MNIKLPLYESKIKKYSILVSMNWPNVKQKRLLSLFETLYSGAFGVADYDFDIGFSESKMVDLIWRT